MLDYSSDRVVAANGPISLQDLGRIGLRYRELIIAVEQYINSVIDNGSKEKAHGADVDKFFAMHEACKISRLAECRLDMIIDALVESDTPDIQQKGPSNDDSPS